MLVWYFTVRSIIYDKITLCWYDILQLNLTIRADDGDIGDPHDIEYSFQSGIRKL